MNSLTVKYRTKRKGELGIEKVTLKLDEFVAEAFKELDASFADFKRKAKHLKRELLTKVDIEKYRVCAENFKTYERESCCKGSSCKNEQEDIKTAREYALNAEKTVDEYNGKWKSFCETHLVNLISKKLCEEVNAKTFKRIDIVTIAKKYAKAICKGIKREVVCGKEFPKNPFTVRGLAELLQDTVKNNGSWEYIFATRYQNQQSGYRIADIEKLLEKENLTTEDFKLLGRYEAGIKRVVYIKSHTERFSAIKSRKDKAILTRITSVIDNCADTMADCVRCQAVVEFGINSSYYKLIDKMEEGVFRRTMRIENSKLKKRIARSKRLESVGTLTYQLF